jgi:cytochrome c oxidase subunit 2
MKNSIILIITIIAAFTIMACSTQQPAAQQPTTQVTGDVAAQPPTVQSAGGAGSQAGNVTQTASDVKEFHINAFQFGFDPSAITVKKGDRVRIILTSRDVTHGFAIPAFGISSDPITQGQSVTVEFTADKVGTFEFFCNIPCGPGHREMTGKLIVTK